MLDGDGDGRSARFVVGTEAETAEVSLSGRGRLHVEQNLSREYESRWRCVGVLAGGNLTQCTVIFAVGIETGVMLELMEPQRNLRDEHEYRRQRASAEPASRRSSYDVQNATDIMHS